MTLVRLAGRNVLRHKRRTLITAAAISVGLAAMIASNTMMNGMDRIISANIINYETGHIEVFAKGYYREEGMFPLDTIIEHPDSLAKVIEQIPGISGVTQRIKFPARISNGVDEFPVLGIGIDPKTESQVFKTRTALVAGSFMDQPDQVLIGVDLARTMGAGVDSVLTLIVRDRNGTYNAYDLTISGLINTDHPLIDGNAVLMNINASKELLALGEGVTEIGVKIKNESQLEDIRKKIGSAAGPGNEAYTYKEVYASIFEVSGFKRAIQFMVALVVVIIAAVGIVNTMLMAVMERIPEIGTLKAMGFGNRIITRIFLYEGGIIGLFGSLIGVSLGLLSSLYIVFAGLDLSRYFNSSDLGYPLKFVIKGEIDPGMVILIFLFGIVVSVLVTLWPVRYATKLQPIDALRHI
jgi:ABC-type lipoprotein release transport system permease subunit